MLSIIIPTYNSAGTIRNAIESIFDQTFKDYELLIIDNCSTDGTLDIIKNYAGSNSRIRWVSEPDRGLYDAMNKGINLSTGDWIYFLGSDDKIFDENVLTNIFKFIGTVNPKVVYGNVLIDGDAGWAKNGQIYDGEFSLSNLINKNICHQALFFNKKVFKRIGGFNHKYNICADWDMNLRLWANYSFFYLNIIVSVFRGGNSSYQVVNNYTTIDKWLTILGSFKLGTLSNEFTKYAQNFLMLSIFFFKKRKYFKSFLLICIFYVHRIRICLAESSSYNNLKNLVNRFLKRKQK